QPGAEPGVLPPSPPARAGAAGAAPAGAPGAQRCRPDPTAARPRAAEPRPAPGGWETSPAGGVHPRRGARGARARARRGRATGRSRRRAVRRPPRLGDPRRSAEPRARPVAAGAAVDAGLIGRLLAALADAPAARLAAA